MVRSITFGVSVMAGHANSLYSNGALTKEYILIQRYLVRVQAHSTGCQLGMSEIFWFHVI